MTTRTFAGAVIAGLSLAVFAGTASPARADYLWLQPEGGQTRAYVGELGKPAQPLPTLTDPKVVVGKGGKADKGDKTAKTDKSAPATGAPTLTPAGDHLSFAAPAGVDQRVTATQAGADGVLTYYAARFGRQDTTAVNDLELVPTEPNGNTYRLFFKGKAVAASQVNVVTAEGWQRVLTPASDGSFTFTPWIPGLYVLDVSARLNNGSAVVGGRKYEDVRHTATLSFEVAR